MRGHIAAVERMKASQRCGALLVQSKAAKADLLEALERIVTALLDTFQARVAAAASSRRRCSCRWQPPPSLKVKGSATGRIEKGRGGDAGVKGCRVLLWAS